MPCDGDSGGLEGGSAGDGSDKSQTEERGAMVVLLDQKEAGDGGVCGRVMDG